MLIKEISKTLKAKCSKSFFIYIYIYIYIYISYDSCWTVANDPPNSDLFLLNNVHLVEKGDIKLPESIFSSIKNCYGVTCNEHKQFLISDKMAMCFNSNNFDGPPLPFSTASRSVSSASLSFTTACRFSSYVSALSHKFISDPTEVCDGTVGSSNLNPSKPIRSSRFLCLSNFHPSKPII